MASTTITGVFTIIDRASGPMRKMEAQALKTMAAIEALGKAMDGMDHNRHAAAMERNARAMRDMERAAKVAGRGAKDLGGELKKGEQNSRGFLGAMQRIRDIAGGLSGILGAIKIGAFAVGISLAAQAIGVLAGGVVALIPRLADLAGVMAAIPSAAGAMAQGIMTVMTAMKGVFGAIGAGMQEAQQAGGGAAQVAGQAAQASRQLMLAQRAEKDAQKGLTDARRDATRQLQDMQLAARGAVLGQQRAALSLAEARDALQRAEMSGASDLEIQGLQLGVQEAELGVDEANQNAKRSQEDLNRAMKGGLNQMPQMIQATRQLEEATWNLNQAQQQLGQGMGGGGGGLSQFQQMMKNLSPEAQKFVRQVIAMRPAFQSLQAAAGKELFPQLGEALARATRLFPTLRANFQATGGVIGRAINSLVGDMTTPKRLGDINTIMQSQTQILGMVGRGFRNIVSAVTDLMVAARPFTEWLFSTIEGWTAMWKETARTGRETGRTQGWLVRTTTAFQMLGTTIKNAWTVMKLLFEAARPLGDALWGGANRAMDGWIEFLRSAEGARKAESWFSGMLAPLHALGQLVKALFVEWGRLAANNGPLTQTAEILTGSVTGIGGLMQQLASLGPPLATTLSQIVRLLNNMPFSPIKTVIDAFNLLLGAVNRLAERIPFLNTILATLLTVTLGAMIGRAILRVLGLGAAWDRVTASAAGAAAAQGAATVAGGMGGTKGMPFGMGGSGKRSFGARAGRGLGIGLIGTLGADMIGQAVGGSTGSAISTIGGDVAMGAGIGMLAGPWGAAAGAAIGGAVGVIRSGLLKGADHAKEAGDRAGKVFNESLRMTNPGSPVNASLQKNLSTAIKNFKKEAEDGGTPSDKTSANAGVAVTQSLTRNDAMSGFKGSGTRNWLVENFTKQTKDLNTQARQSGAMAMVQWMYGQEQGGRAVKNSTRNLIADLLRRFGPELAGQFGFAGKHAYEQFVGQMKSRDAYTKLRRTLKETQDQFNDLKFERKILMNPADPRQTKRAIEESLRLLDRQVQELEKDPRNKPKIRQIRMDQDALRRQLRNYLSAAAEQTKWTLPNPNMPAIFQRGGGFTNPLGILAQRVDVPAPNLGPTNAALDSTKKASETTKSAITAVGTATSNTASTVNTNSASMSSNFGNNLQDMTDKANGLLGALGARKVEYTATQHATGGRLNPFAGSGSGLYAAGGRIPGSPQGDHIPLVGRGGALLGIADGGELVVNRHTEQRINKMLASHGTSLGREVAGESRPHWKGFEEGGRLDVPVYNWQPDGVAQIRSANSMFSRAGRELQRRVDRIDFSDGTVQMDGKPVPSWIAQILRRARMDDVSFAVSSGVRSRAEQTRLWNQLGRDPRRVARPGTSNHEKTKYPGGAVDIGEGGWQNLNRWLEANPKYHKYLKHYNFPADPYHFSHLGNAYGGRLRFGGWHGTGMDGMVSSPTLIGVGENGPERVKVTPTNSTAGKAKGGKIEVNIANIHYAGKGDIAKAIKQEMEMLGEELALMGGLDDE